MIHERATGSLRDDLESAHLDMTTDPNRHRSWRSGLYTDWREQTPSIAHYAKRYNLWPEALEAYIHYQSESVWHDAFVAGVVVD